jgi:hypothetical protein
MPATSTEVALTYLCQVRFHQSIICPSTRNRISFALCGLDWNPANRSKPTILYCLPSSCTRYAGILFDGICRKLGIRLVAIDRPGCGATPMCPLKDRIKVSTIHTESVLSHLYNVDLLDEDQPLLLFSHSAGVLYTLQLLTGLPHDKAVRYFGRSPRWLCSSSWVPTSISKQAVLANLPTFVLNMGTFVLPGLAQVGLSLEPSVAWLKQGSVTGMAWSGTTDAKRHDRRKEKSKKRFPNADFWPPYPSDVATVALEGKVSTPSSQGTDFTRLGFEMMSMERFL